MVPALIYAQATAQTVTKMTINVNVKGGATVNLQNDFEIKYNGFEDDLSTVFVSEGAIELYTPVQTDMVVTQTPSAELVNEYGEHIMIQQLEQSEVRELGKRMLSFKSAVDSPLIPRGTYEGQYRASIEYL